MVWKVGCLPHMVHNLGVSKTIPPGKSLHIGLQKAEKNCRKGSLRSVLLIDVFMCLWNPLDRMENLKGCGVQSSMGPCRFKVAKFLFRVLEFEIQLLEFVALPSTSISHPTPGRAWYQSHWTSPKAIAAPMRNRSLQYHPYNPSCQGLWPAKHFPVLEP